MFIHDVDYTVYTYLFNVLNLEAALILSHVYYVYNILQVFTRIDAS